MLSPCMLKNTIRRSSCGDKSQLPGLENSNEHKSFSKGLASIFCDSGTSKIGIFSRKKENDSFCPKDKSPRPVRKKSDEFKRIWLLNETGRRASMPVVLNDQILTTKLLVSLPSSEDSDDSHSLKDQSEYMIIKIEDCDSPKMMLGRFDEMNGRNQSSNGHFQGKRSSVFSTGTNSSNKFGAADHLKTSRRASLGVIGLRRDSMLSGKEGNSILPNEVVIKIHQYTDDPSMAWEMLKSTTPVRPVRQMKLDTPVRNDAVRFVSVACTYGVFLDPKKIPPGDVLLICGDFTSCGLPQEVKGFNDNLALLKHPFKIVIAGNHECTFDESFMKMAASRHMDVKEGALKHALNAAMAASKITNPKSLLTNCIYLQDNLVELFGLKIYGTPWQPKNDKWAFNLNRGQPLLDKWNLIPSGIDVLLTHAAPLGHGDLMVTGNRAGCVELLNSVVKRIRPAYHVYGHIHEGYGCSSDGYTKFINCSIVNENLEPTNTPVIFDIAVNHEIKSSFIRNAKKIVKKVNKS